MLKEEILQYQERRRDDEKNRNKSTNNRLSLSSWVLYIIFYDWNKNYNTIWYSREWYLIVRKVKGLELRFPHFTQNGKILISLDVMSYICIFVIPREMTKKTIQKDTLKNIINKDGIRKYV